MTKDRKCAGCENLVYRDSKTGLCKDCYGKSTAHVPVTLAAVTATETLAADREKRRLADELSRTKALYSESLKTIEQQEADLRAMNVMASGQASFDIVPSVGQRGNEGTAVIVASDWHAEEKVLPGQVNGLNEYSLDICTRRATKFFQASLNLVQLLEERLAIPNIILALLGDFITNNIHGEDNAETNALQPMHAITFAMNLLISGIDFLLANTTATFVVPCHSGNHARTTQKTRFASENGHSLEYLMYLTLAAHYRHEPRITFLIAEGMHSYVDVYKGEPGATTIRFHHGHAVKYGGGVGGIYIPVNKAIAQWSKARHADLDVFGHFHQMRDGGAFLCNGSLIGYNSFALSIKADFEMPRQLLFLIDRKRGRTCTWPILVR
jgi:hypothetical protein